jgi:hypothetical protein
MEKAKRVWNGVLVILSLGFLFLLLYLSRRDQLSGNYISPTDRLATVLTDLKKGKPVKFETVRQSFPITTYSAFVREAAEKAGMDPNEARDLLDSSIVVTTQPATVPTK